MPDELPRVLQLLWGREEPGAAGRSPVAPSTTSRAAGVRSLTTGGLAGRVDERGGRTRSASRPMALYRYVDSKSDLYVAMVDAAYGPPARARPTGGWRKQLEAWASGQSRRTADGTHGSCRCRSPTAAGAQPVALDGARRSRVRRARRCPSRRSCRPCCSPRSTCAGRCCSTNQMGGAIADESLTERDHDARYVNRLADADRTPNVPRHQRGAAVGVAGRRGRLRGGGVPLRAAHRPGRDRGARRPPRRRPAGGHNCVENTADSLW